MAEFQEILDFPPAPKLNWEGKLDPAKAKKWQMAILAWRYYVTTRALSNK